MRFALAQKVADAVLYEGYVLYPYRASSSKNQVRFQFGVVAPDEYCQGEGRGSEFSFMQTECLVERATPDAAPRLELKIRCLQLQARTLEEAVPGGVGGKEGFRSVEFLNHGGELLVAWDEGVERELTIPDVSLLDLLRPMAGAGGEGDDAVAGAAGAAGGDGGDGGEGAAGAAGDGRGRQRDLRIAFDLPGGLDVEELRSAVAPPALTASTAEVAHDAHDAGAAEDGSQLEGRVIRQRWPIAAVVLLSAEALPELPGLVRLRVRIENRTPCPPGLSVGRTEALRHSLLSAHTLLAVSGGSFVSLLDPPPAAALAASGCASLRTWPVLIGDETRRDLILSSPIILYDFPAIAPESQGDLYDATEIDEILTLRIMTLTDEEKREARGTDPRARKIIERADGLPDEIFERLHGAVRSLRSDADAWAPGMLPERAVATATAEAAMTSAVNAPSPAAAAKMPAPAPAQAGTFPSSAASAPNPSSPVQAGPLPSASPDRELSSWEAFLNPPGETPPEESTIAVAGVVVGKGSRVRLRPSRRADSMDFFLAGREARVEGVFMDVENESYIAVTLHDDLAADLSSGTGRFFYFYPDEIEPLPEETAGPVPGAGLADHQESGIRRR